MLTRKQLELLKFIDKRTRLDGVTPSFDEMKDALDLRLEVRNSPPDQCLGGTRLHPPDSPIRRAAIEVLKLPEVLEAREKENRLYSSSNRRRPHRPPAPQRAACKRWKLN